MRIKKIELDEQVKVKEVEQVKVKEVRPVFKTMDCRRKVNLG